MNDNKPARLTNVVSRLEGYKVDPSLIPNDYVVGNLVSKINELVDTVNSLTLIVNSIETERVVKEVKSNE